MILFYVEKIKRFLKTGWKVSKLNKKVNTLSETPSQTAGPFLHIGCTPNLIGIKNVFKRDFGVKSFKNINKEKLINISGFVFDGSGVPITDVMIETWQCNSEGFFLENEGFSRVVPDLESGKYIINTIKPGFTKNEYRNPQSPHILFWIVARGINQPLITRMYFDENETKEDYLFSMIKEKNRKKTLLAKKIDENHYLFNIYLQGEKETVFFDF